VILLQLDITHNFQSFNYKNNSVYTLSTWSSHVPDN